MDKPEADAQREKTSNDADGPATLSIVLLLLCTQLVDLTDMGGRVTRLWLLVVAALVKDLRQVGSVDLPELLIVI